MIIFITTFFFLASAIIANKVALGFISPLTLVTIRMLGGGIILFWYERPPLHLFWKHTQKIFLIAFYTTILNSLLKAYALNLVSSSTAALISATDPFITICIAGALFGQPIYLTDAVGTMIAACGISILTMQQPLFLTATCTALICTFAALVSGRYGWLTAQHMLKQNELSVTQLNSGMMIIAGASLAPFALLTDTQPVHLSPTLCIALAVTTIIGNGIAYPLYAYLLKNYSPTTVSIGGFLVPTFVIILQSIQHMQQPSLSICTGAAFIGFGLILSTYKSNTLPLGIPFMQRRQ